MDFEGLEPVLRLLDDPPGRRLGPSRLAWGSCLIAAMAFTAYLWSVSANKLFWLDEPTLHSINSLEQIGYSWMQSRGGYRPLALTLLAAEQLGLGNSAVSYHWITLLLHVLTAIVLWLVLRRLEVRGAWLAAALFAVWPTQTASVSWMSHQPQVLCGLMCLLAVWLALQALRVRASTPDPEDYLPDEPRLGEEFLWGTYATALFFALAAALCGPVGMTIPLVLIVLIAWKRERFTLRDLAWTAPFIAIALAVLALTLLLHRPYARSLAVTPPVAEGRRILLATSTLWVSVLQMLRPWPGHLLDPLAWPLTGGWPAVPAVLFVAAIVLGLVYRKRWGAEPLVALLLLLALLLPRIIRVATGPHPSPEPSGSNLYLATTISAVILASLLIRLATRLSHWHSLPLRAARAWVAGGGFVILIAFTIAQASFYSDADSAFERSLARDPRNDSIRAQYALLLARSEPIRAMKLLDDAGEATSEDVTLLAARADVRRLSGLYEQSVADYLLAQRLAPDHPDVRLGLAKAYESAGAESLTSGRQDQAFRFFEGALASYGAALQLDANNEAAVDGIGSVLLQEGRAAESVAQFDRAILLDPSYVPARIHRADALFRLGIAGDREKLDLAFAGLKQACRIDPVSPLGYCLAAEFQFRFGHFVSAEFDARAATQCDPYLPEGWAQLGFAQLAQNRSQEAVRSFERAMKLRANFPDAARGMRLAQAQLAAGNP